MQLEKDAANRAHPLSKFSTGTKQTLETIPLERGLDVRKTLLDYHGKYYSANLMTLCVCARQPVEQLESWVRRCFSAVPNNKAADPALAWWGLVEPYQRQTAASLLEVVPVAELRRMSLAWPLWVRTPAEREALQRSRPETLVSHLIGHEGAGSVRAFLAKKGWANGVGASVNTETSDLQVGEVALRLF